LTTNEKRLAITQWSVDDRPREKLIQKGSRNLSNAELIAILISSGTKEKSAVDLAKELLNITGNSLEELGKLSIKQLTKIKGIGEAKAIAIAAALEIGRRRKEENPLSRNKISSSKDVYNYMYPILVDIQQEEFYTIFLKRSNEIISAKRISLGGVSGTLVDIKIIFKHAVDELASSIILCHNHPSGNKNPSQADIDLTKKIKEGSNFFDISLLDHLIFTNNAYFSFADEGLI